MFRLLHVKIETELGTIHKDLLVIDGHSHLGRDVDGAEMMNPLAPGTGTFDFWANVQAKLREEWNKKGTQSFAVELGGQITHYSFEFSPLRFWDRVVSHVSSNTEGTYRELYNKTRGSTLIDQGVVFPFQDVFRDNKPEARYRASNMNVSRFTTRFPFSLRLIGYCRVDPLEGDKAVREVTFAATQLGVRGLKLHPRSEGWIDHVDSDLAVAVLVEAAKHSLPVIFDTRGRKSILDIANLVARTRNTLQNGHPELVPHLKVLVGHCAQGNVGDVEVYRALVQPNTWGELSMLHGQGAANFFEDFRRWYAESGLQAKTGRRWSEYFIFGTDYPYFGDMHAAKLVAPIISPRFFQSGGTIEDVENILGKNLVKLLPEYGKPVTETRPVPKSSTFVMQPSPNEDATDAAFRAIAILLERGDLDVRKVLFQFAGDFNTFNEEFLVEAFSPKTKQAVKLVLMNFVKGRATLLSTLAEGTTWKPLGFKYFNPDDRNFFLESFSKSACTSTDAETASQVAQMF